MAFTYGSRKAARKKIATLLSQVPGFDRTADHEVKDLLGEERTAMVFSAGTRNVYSGVHDQYFGFWILIIVERVDAATAEDDIDDLEVAARQHLWDNRVQAEWDDFEFGDGTLEGEDITETFYPTDTIFRQDGRQYKHSLFRVTVRKCV